MSTKYGGYMGCVLTIDLTTRKTNEYLISDEDRKLYLGGKILAAKILYDNIKTCIEPLSSENIIVIMTGPLTGSGAPSSGRFNISTISPQTGFCTSSNCGGSFGLHLKKAGYDGLVITGESSEPVWIEITDEKIEFHNAENLLGLTTSKTQESLGGRSGKLVIGPAGENLVRYAGVFSEERTAGRAGVGAVFGSKKLKAITATGLKTVNIIHKQETKDLNKKWVQKLREHPITGKQLPQLGTAGLLSSMNIRHMLATRNYKYGRFAGYDKISGELLAEKYLVKNKGCITCPIQCSRVVNIDGKNVKGPEVETLGLLGSNLENDNLELILKWNYELDELGMDTISTGSTLGYAMELNEKGMWENGLEFGKTDNISDIFEDIAYRRGIGDLLADGTKRLAEKFGGVEFAINSKGLELAAYEPRGAVGQGLGYAVSNRGGCHVNGGYMVVLEGLGLSINPYTVKSKAELTMTFQNIMEAVSAGGNCIFTTYSLLLNWLVSNPNSFTTRCANKLIPHCGWIVSLFNKYPDKLLGLNVPSIFPYSKAVENVTGMKMNIGKFLRIGERGYNIERLLNMRLGLNTADDKLPPRLTAKNQIAGDERTKVPLDELKRRYYKCRGWDTDGKPKDKLIKKLNIEV